MNIEDQYKSALREKIESAGYKIIGASEKSFRVAVPEVPAVAAEKITVLMSSAGAIQAEATEAGSVVTVAFQRAVELNG